MLANYTDDEAAVLFRAYFDEYKEINEKIAADIGERKDLRKRIVGDGFDIKAFDAACKDSERSGELRERKHREYMRYMIWIGKPVGFQAALDLGAPAPAAGNGAAAPEVSPHQVARVQDEGRAAGGDGRARTQNPWSPGTYLWQVWDDNWAEAQAESEAAAPPPPPSYSAPNLTPSGKRRGRPPGSRNRTRRGAGASA